MKICLLYAGTLIAIASKALGQGSFELDNRVGTNVVSIDMPRNPYSGIYGMEVWQTTNTNPSLSGAIDLAALTNSQVAYAMMLANGFVLEHTFSNLRIANGYFVVGELQMPDIPPSATVSLALAAWNSGAANWGSASASGAKGGLIAFVQPTGYYLITPPVALPDLNWTVAQDLVMMEIPEPATLPLVLLSTATLLSFRKRKDKRIEPGK